MNFDKSNFFLKDTCTSFSYTGIGRNSSNFPKRNNIEHGQNLKVQYLECLENEEEKNQIKHKYKKGFYIDFFSKEQFDLKIESLENETEKISLLNVKKNQDSGITKATVFVPEHKKDYFLKKIEAYSLPVIGSILHPKNDKLISSIEKIKNSNLKSFLNEDELEMQDNLHIWYEIWFKFEKGSENFFDIINCLNKLNISYSDKYIDFPEVRIRLIKASKLELSNLIENCGNVVQIVKAQEIKSFLESLSINDKTSFVDDLLRRTSFKDSKSFICLLDSGLTLENPLIKPAVEDEKHVQSIDSISSLRDIVGHGTEMAGIAIYNELSKLIESPYPVEINHKIESIKIFPDKNDNKVDLYGEITKQAVALAEIENPRVNRTFCMAITSKFLKDKDGRPTSWSASLDSIAYGIDNDNEKRLFLVSAGNVHLYEFNNKSYPDVNLEHSVENPGQSWNAITVGAINHEILNHVTDIPDEYSSIADVDELSPFSSTSVCWDSKWPIKPEIILDGGSFVSNGVDNQDHDDLSLITTSSKPLSYLLTTICGTSSATAQAAWLSAQIYAKYPNAWPETVRALIIHSARWPSKLKSQFCKDETKQKDINKLLHICGYGVPNLSRAIHSADNSVTLIIQEYIQPFTIKNKTIKFQDIQIHEIPWPSELLYKMNDVKVVLRVTLSYFIEPGLSAIEKSNKYKYQSCGLKFEVNKVNETKEDFENRLIPSMNDSESTVNSNSDLNWYFGPINRNGGSIHSDYCTMNAIDLFDTRYIAVMPTSGWWRYRKSLKKYESKIRYSLVVSVETPESECDLYNEIKTKIEIKQGIKIPIQI